MGPAACAAKARGYLRPRDRPSVARRIPRSRASGVGGQPGTVTSTGMTFATAPQLAYDTPNSPPSQAQVPAAITMRGDRPIYRNHLTVPDTDHQVLPRLCHEAVLFNRVSEIGLTVKDVRVPTWGAALSVIIQVISFKTTGKRVFRMSPIHHHFELGGWKETKVVFVFWMVGLVASVVGLLMMP